MQRTLRVAAALFLGWLALASIGSVHALEWGTADHSKFPELQREFQSGPEVTQACLACHSRTVEEIMNSQHWKWEFTHPQSGQELGKLRVVNNYCTSAQSNLDGCATCHIGYNALTDQGVKNDPNLIDCLACHVTTDYSKPSGLGGNVFGADFEMPSGRIIPGQDLRAAAQSVGATSRQTCGSCHFLGGGGDGVKHGEMDSSLGYPDRNLDVHMDADGMNFTCATCHQPDGHQIPGSRYAPAAADPAGTLTCQTCHGQAPHKGENSAKLNSHNRTLTCQTCHIPAMARGGVFTMTSWDWSTAGKLDEDGKQFTVYDDYGNKIYESRKGDMTYAENLAPDYIWFNGDVEFTLPSMVIDPSKAPIYINRYLGSPTDGRSKIWPVKTMRGKQPFDPVTGHITVNQLFGDNDTAYWKNLNWPNAIEVGMRAAGLPFSGEVDFIETVSQWPVNHMVAPKEQSLGCADCHSRGGRLENVEGIYIVGQDHHPRLDNAAKLLALLTLLGVLGHGALRIFISWKN